jgi:hypothetical protein
VGGGDEASVAVSLPLRPLLLPQRRDDHDSSERLGGERLWPSLLPQYRDSRDKGGVGEEGRP